MSDRITFTTTIVDPDVPPTLELMTSGQADAEARRFGFRLGFVGPAAAIHAEEFPAAVRERAIRHAFVAILQSERIRPCSPSSTARSKPAPCTAVWSW
jgi:hypothetical protein